MESNNFKTKIGNFFGICKTELMKATKIGQSLVGAGFLNDQKASILREMGEWLVQQVETGKLKLDSEYVQSCVEELKRIEDKIKLLDQEIKDLKEINPRMRRSDDASAP